MAQPIRPAQMQMDLVNVANGTPGMSRTSAPSGPQGVLDPMSNPMMPTQGSQQMFLGQQQARNNQMDAQMQYAAGAERQENVMMSGISDAENRAKRQRDITVATILEEASAPNMAMLMGQKGMAEKVTRDAMQMMAINKNIPADLADYNGQMMA